MPTDELFQQRLPIVTRSDHPPLPVTHVAHMRGDEQAFHDNFSIFLNGQSPDVVVLVMPVEPHTIDEVRRVLDAIGGAVVERIEPLA